MTLPVADPVPAAGSGSGGAITGSLTGSVIEVGADLDRMAVRADADGGIGAKIGVAAGAPAAAFGAD
jgi:hypothetical protein